MRRSLIVAAGFALVAACGLAQAVPWTVVVPPGVYGRVAIGGYAEPPRLYAPQPLVGYVDRYGRVVEEYVDPAFGTEQMPVYLWVPEFQRVRWGEFCGEYGACGVPVYFVEDHWYRDNVLRRNWTPEQRAWTPAQWLEQDRLARERFERQRFEQQRTEQQQRWASERAWHDNPRLPQPPVEQQAAASPAEPVERPAPSRWTRLRDFLFGHRAQAQAAASAAQGRGTALGMRDQGGPDRPEDARAGLDRGRPPGR